MTRNNARAEKKQASKALKRRKVAALPPPNRKQRGGVKVGDTAIIVGGPWAKI